MKLWTIQNIDFLNQSFPMIASNRFVDKDFNESYKVINTFAKKNIKNYKAKTPIWTWTKKPDLRSHKYFYDSLQPLFLEMVLIELEIPNKTFVS